MEQWLLRGMIALISLWMVLKSKDFVWQRWFIFYFALYPTKFGIKFMRKIASKYRKILYWIGVLGIVIGYLGILLISEELIRGIYTLFTNPQITVGLVLPIKAKGVLYVPFLYWIISLIIVMIVHEGAHGIIAMVHKLKIKKTGLAFLGAIIPIIPAAFVEPDEEKLMKSSNLVKLSVFAAGPFANIVLGFILLFAHSVLMGGLSNGLWVKELVFWIMLLNLGVGLFNLVPIGPIDGGRMFQVALEKIMQQKKAVRIWKAVSYGLLVLVASNILFALFL
jgi:membrane-associated protease RseP (regulator of RpoE activity)